MKWLLFAFLIAIPLVAQPQEGPADHCDNFANNAHKCECEHTTCTPDGKPNRGAMSNKCQTYCREDHCHCISSCDT